MTVPELTQLSENVVAVPAGHSNAYLWTHGADVTLVDAGEVGCHTLILDVLRHLGRSERDLTRIVLTHWHHDHTGAAAALVDLTGARVYAGRADAAVIRGDVPGTPPDLTPAEEPLMARIAGLVAVAPPCPVHHELDDGAVVLAAPGHTTGSVAVHLPAERVLLTGDIAAHFGGQVVLGPFNTDRDQASESLRRLARLDVDAVGFGHGPPITANAAAALAAWTDPHS